MAVRALALAWALIHAHSVHGVSSHYPVHGYHHAVDVWGNHGSSLLHCGPVVSQLVALSRQSTVLRDVASMVAACDRKLRQAALSTV